MFKQFYLRTLGAVLSAGLLMGLAVSPAARAQDYPNKPIRLVAGIAAGGMTDIVARTMAQKLTERLGQPVLVENRAGAGGNIGTEAVVRAPADGYTLLFAYPGPVVVNPSLYKNLGFDPVRDLAPVSLLGSYPLVIAVGPALPSVRTLGEFIDYAKKNPGQLDYASAGNASTAHLAMELFRREVGIDMQHIPYKGSAPGLTDLLAGRVAVAFDALPVVMPHHAAGRLRALAMSSQARTPAFPDIPGMADAGVKNVDVFGWFGIFAPAATPRPVIDRLSRELAAIVRDPAVAKDLLSKGIEPKGTPPEELASLVRRERDVWARVVQQAGIKVD
jgi:tripartite-type tricarboxylate transporter receptor subunit TctC